jgi:hypothetical protein
MVDLVVVPVRLDKIVQMEELVVVGGIPVVRVQQQRHPPTQVVEVALTTQVSTNQVS